MQMSLSLSLSLSLNVLATCRFPAYALVYCDVKHAEEIAQREGMASIQVFAAAHTARKDEKCVSWLTFTMFIRTQERNLVYA
jgi:hypothetical protein